MRTTAGPEHSQGTAAQRGHGIDNLQLFRRGFQIHASQDPLVAWGLQPGPGRVPATGSTELLVQAMDSWIRWLEEGHRFQELP